MTKRPLLSLFVAALVLAGSWPGLAASELWRATASGSFVTLTYGPIDPQARPKFLLSCLNGVNIAVLSVYMDLPEKEAGLSLTIELSGGGQTASVAGETARDEASGIIYGNFGDIAVTPILKILREKGPVTMKAGAAKVTLSDAGRDQAVDRFAKDCKLN